MRPGILLASAVRLHITPGVKLRDSTAPVTLVIRTASFPTCYFLCRAKHRLRDHGHRSLRIRDLLEKRALTPADDSPLPFPLPRDLTAIKPEKSQAGKPDLQ